MFSFGAAPAFREDWAVRNERNHKLEVSVWHHTTPARGVVLYVHDMLGSRTNVVEVLAPLLAAGCSVAAVDCKASGLSEGTHVTLGYFERFDVAAVAAELRLRYSVGGPGVNVQRGIAPRHFREILAAVEDWEATWESLIIIS